MPENAMSQLFFLKLFKAQHPPPVETQRTIYANARCGNKHSGYVHAHNKIKTSKYTIITYLPKNLYEQFTRLANAYFAFIFILQCIPLISSLNPITTIIPLIIVLGITAAKDGLDDLNRHRSDRTVNNRVVEVLDPTKMTESNLLTKEKWMNIRTGDIIKIKQDELVTADVLLLSTSDPHNLAYIETAELDGETNLKVRHSIQATGAMMDSEADPDGVSCYKLAAFDGRIICEPPNNRLDRFTGTLSWRNGTDRQEKRYPLTNENILLRGTTIKNVDWAFGVVIFAGPDTKLMQNCGKTFFKRTSVDNFLNRLVVYICGGLVLLAVVSMVGHIIFEMYHGDHFQSFLPWEFVLYSSKGMPELISGSLIFWSYIIILNTLVPVSLYVSVEIIRLGQSYFINWDRQLYAPDKDQGAEARTTTLNEELGQVQYIFSDKTGTLTQNIMVFKMCSISGFVYGNLPGKSTHNEPCDFSTFNPRWYDHDFQFYDSRLLAAISQKHEKEIEFFTLLALNHTVMPKYNEDGNICYQAQSPDEGALVKAARCFGLVFLSRSPDTITIYDATQDQNIIFELLHILDFDNERKRMSVIVRKIEPDGSKGPIMLYCKGADMTVMDRLRQVTEEDFDSIEQTKVHLDEFSAEGLRTLCLAYRVIDEDWFQEWTSHYRKAACSLSNRDELLCECYEEIEKEMVLLGVSAVEDKLQEDVSQTIANLGRAGIKMWVLTGDKLETAINIGYSCNLLTDDMLDVFFIEGNTAHEVKCELLRNYETLCRKSHPDNDYGLVITGTALGHALEAENENNFLKVALKCKTVICCRVTPLQKAKVVQLVKRTQAAVTLAIGDGANDVSMIKEAHIGVGISGEEGTQAVLASDYSIAQFKFLERLLLVHGRWSYFRMCRFLDYFFYKNFAFTLIHFWFAFLCGFSAANVYDQWMITIYNVFFTSFPPLCLGLLDKDVNDKMCILNPSLYRLGQAQKLFNLRIFLYSVLRALITSMILFFVPFVVFIEAIGNEEWGVSENNSNGLTFGRQAFAFLVATCLVIIVNLQVALDTAYWTLISHFFIWGSMLLYFGLHFFMYSNGVFALFPKIFPFVGVGRFVIDKPIFWATLILTIIIYVIPVLSFRLYKSITKPSYADKIREQRYKQKRRKERGKKPITHVTRRSGSQRPGTQRPGSSYAFAHQRGFADLIMSGRMTSKRRRDKTTLNHLARAGLSLPSSPKKTTITIQTPPKPENSRMERLVE